MRAEIGCDGQSVCVSGCPTGAKRSTAVSYLPEALKKNAFLFSHMKVKKILYEKGEVKGVVAGVPNYGNEFDLTIHAKVVALAAGAFGTPEVLHHSQIYSDHLGKHLSIHPAFTIGGLFHEPVRESKFVPQSVGVFGFEEDDFVLEGYTLPVDVIPVAMAQWGAELRQLMDEVNHFTNFSSMLKDTSEGELIFTPWGTIPKYFVNKKLMKRAQRSVQFMANVFFNAGAKKIYLPFQGLKVVTSRKELEGLDQLEVHPSRAILSAHHPLGTCRMAGSKDQGAISEEGEWFGMKNLLVVDGSAIPGPIGVNPQVTIMANALRIANIWSERC